jgi:hypothetical protein
LKGEAGDVGDGVFFGKGIFRDMGGVDLKDKAGLGEEFAAAWGCGCEDQHREIIAGVCPERTQVRTSPF